MSALFGRACSELREFRARRAIADFRQLACASTE